jgi:hypothetical protein
LDDSQSSAVQTGKATQSSLCRLSANSLLFLHRLFLGKQDMRPKLIK